MINSTTAYSQTNEQLQAFKAVLNALQIPFEENPVEETTYLLSSDANKKRLFDSFSAEKNGVWGCYENRKFMEIVLLPQAIEDLQFWKF